MSQEEKEAVVIDAEDQILGRLASQIAERVNQGQQVTVVNAQRALISGRREEIVAKYRKRKEIGSRYQGPFYPNSPAGILKRTIRGMIADNKLQTGSLIIENGTGDVEKEDFISFDDADKSNLKKQEYLYLEELASALSKEK